MENIGVEKYGSSSRQPVKKLGQTEKTLRGVFLGIVFRHELGIYNCEFHLIVVGLPQGAGGLSDFSLPYWPNHSMIFFRRQRDLGTLLYLPFISQLLRKCNLPLLSNSDARCLH